MSREVQGMLIQIEATTAQLRRELQEADRTVNRTRQKVERELGAVDASFDRTAKRAQQAGTLIKGAFAAIAGAGLAGSLIKQADAYGEMVDRMKMATDSAAEYDLVQKRLMATAKSTYRPLREAQELYIRTADVIKGLGYNTQQTLDLTDSFSYLLVANSASAEKAAAALGAYDRALQSGQINTRRWQQLTQAMPTLVNAIADEIGKTTNEVRQMALSGQLAVEDINNALLSTLEANKEAAENMRTTIGDALTNLQTGLQDLIGRSNETIDVTGKLAAALELVADNLESIAIVAAAAGMGALISSTVKATAAAVRHAAELDRQWAAAERSARAAVASAAAQLEYTKAQLASTQATIAATTGMKRLSLVQAELLPRQAAVAQATNALAAAQANLAKTLPVTTFRGLLTLLGGPTGLAITAATVAAGFLAIRGGADDAAIGMESLTQSVEEYARTWERAGAAQRRVLLNETRQGIEQAQQEIETLAKGLVDSFDKASRETWGGWVLTADIIASIEEIQQAALAGEGDIDAMVQELLKLLPAGSSVRTEIERLAGELANKSDLLVLLNERTEEYTDRIDENTVAQRENAQATVEMSEAANKYLASLQNRMDQLWASGDPVKQALLHIKEHGRYTKEEADAILKDAQALKEKQDAQRKSTSATKGGTAAVRDQLAGLDSLIAKYDPLAKGQDDFVKGAKLAAKALEKDEITLKQYRKIISGLGTDLKKIEWDRQTKATEKLDKQLKKLDDQVEALRDRFEPMRTVTRQWRKEQDMLAEALENGAIKAEEYQLLLQQLEHEYLENTRVTTQWGEWTESALERVDSAFADAWRNIGDGFKGFRNSLTNAFKQMLAELAHMAITRPIVMQIGAAMGVGGMSTSAMAGGMLGGGGGGGGMSIGNLLQYGQTAYSAITGWGAAGWAGFQSGGLSGAMSGIAGHYGGMFAGGMGGFGAGVQGAYLAPGLAGPTTAGAGGMMGAGNTVGNLGASAPWLSGISGAFMGYQNAGVKGAVAGGAGGWAGAKGGAMVGSYFGPIGTAAGAVIGGMLGAIGGSKIFGSGEKYKRTVGSATGYYGADGYVSTGNQAGWFDSSRKFGEEHDSALDHLNRSFQEALGGIYDIFGEEIELSTTARTRLRRTSGKMVGDFITEIDGEITNHFRQYSKKGNTAEAMEQFANDIMGEYLAAHIASSEKLPEHFRQQFDGLTGAEEVAATLAEVFGRFEGVNAALELTGHTLYELTNEGMKASDQLIDLIGGLENLQAATSVYYDNFFTDMEKQEHAIKSITQAFEDAGVALPETRDQFRAMVEDIDTTTESGREMYATMMLLAGQAAQFFDIAEQRAAQAVANAMGAANASFGLVQRSISAERNRLTQEFNAAVQAEQAAAQRAAAAAQASASARASSLSNAAAASSELVKVLQSLDRAMSNALERLRSTEADAVALRRDQSIQLLQGALAQARSGKSLSGIEGLEGALGVAATIDTAIYRTFEGFEREQGRTANLIAELQDLNGQQLTAEERLLEQLQRQAFAAQTAASQVNKGISGISSQLQEDYEAAMAALDKELEAAQSQMDALNGIDNSILSVGAAIDLMGTKVVAAIQAQSQAAAGRIPSVSPADTLGQSSAAGLEATIQRMYESTLGYSADAQGVRHWTERIQAGESLSVLQGALNQAALSAAVPAFASGGLHAGGLRLVGENGPELEVTGPSRIYSSSQTASMLAGANSRDVVVAIGKLEQRLDYQSAALREVAKNTMRTAKRVETLEYWDQDGMPDARGA